MVNPRIAVMPLLTGLFALLPATEAAAQACIGVPIRDGQMSVQGEVLGRAHDSGLGYGGRLAINFDTPTTMDFTLQRPTGNAAPRAVVGSHFAFEMDVYEPSICPYLGVRYEIERPDDARNGVVIPVGMGVGKSVGSARGLSMSLFFAPEYRFRVNPADGEEADLFDEVLARSAAHGSLGLILGTPFLYGIGSVQVGTESQDRPTFVLGAGLIF